MLLRLCCIVSCCFLLLLSTATGGERPAVRLTGNPGVDLFSDLHHLPGERWNPSDSLPPGQMFISSSEEKSPWLAGVLSLALPGVGEAYSRNYVKAAVFAAVEVSSWILAYTNNKQGNQRTEDYHAFANQHWSAARYANYTIQNLSGLNSDLAGRETEFGDKVFPDDAPYDRSDPPTCNYPFRCVSWTGLNEMEDAVRQRTGNGYSHQLPPLGEQQYYELIGKYAQFRNGWDDDASLGPTTELPSANSHMIQYATSRAEANHSYDVAGTFVSVAVINHIVSALDAFWSATRFNKSLHAEVRMRVQPTRLGVMPLTEAKFRYDF